MRSRNRRTALSGSAPENSRHDLAADECLHVGNAAHAVARGKLGLLVGIDFRQHEAARVFGRELFQNRRRARGMARTTAPRNRR